VRGRCGTDSRGEQSFEAGVPAVHGEPSVGRKRTARATHFGVSRRPDQRPQGTYVLAHASRVRLRVGTCGKELARQVKAVVKILQALRRRRSESEPARKQRPARAGAAPREGKALEGRSRDASGHHNSGESPGGDETARRRGPRQPEGSTDLERAASC